PSSGRAARISSAPAWRRPSSRSMTNSSASWTSTPTSTAWGTLPGRAAEPPQRGAAVDIRPIRRVGTGHDAGGRAGGGMDGPAGRVLHRPSRPGVALTDLWATTGTPAARVDGDPVDRPVVLHPPPGGTVFRIVQFDPEDGQALAGADGTAAFAAM